MSARNDLGQDPVGRTLILGTRTAFVVCVWLLTSSIATAVPAPIEVLENMRVADEFYAASLTIQGRTRRVKDRYTPELGEYGMTFTFTQNAAQEAIIYHATELPEISVVPSPAKSPNQGEYIAPFLSTWVYGGPQQQGESHVSSTRITAEDTLEDLVKTPERLSASITISSPARGKSPHIVRLLRAIGRGFTEEAMECTRVEAASDGMLQIHLRTSYGEWALLVDPKLDYLVREGHYTRDGDEQPSVSTKNSGLVDSAVPVPTYATYEDHKGVYLGEQPYEIEQAAFKTDEALLTEAEAALSPDNFPEMHVLLEDIRTPGITRSLTRDPHGPLKRIPNAHGDMVRSLVQETTEELAQKLTLTVQRQETFPEQLQSPVEPPVEQPPNLDRGWIWLALTVALAALACAVIAGARWVTRR